MRRIFIIVGLLLVSSALWSPRVFAQETFETFIDAGYNTFPNAIVQTKDSGYAVVVSTTGSTFIKINTSGKVEWERGFIKVGLTTAIIRTKNGGFATIGVVPPSSEIFVAILDSQANTEWSELIGSSGQKMTGQSMTQLSDGGYALVCTVEMDNGAASLIVKIDSVGMIVWYNMYHLEELNHYEYAEKIFEQSDGSLIVFGGDVYGTNGVNSGTVTMERISSEGKTLKHKEIFVSESAEGYDAVKTSDGNFVVCGAGFETTIENSNLIAVKLDTNGNVIWTASINDLDISTGKGIFEASNKDLAILTVGDDDANKMVVFLDSEGVFKDARQVVIPSLTIFSQMIAPTFDNGYAILGYASSSDTSLAFSSPVIMKFDSGGVGCNVQSLLCVYTIPKAVSAYFLYLTDTNFSIVVTPGITVPPDISTVAQIDFCSLAIVPQPITTSNPTLSISPNPISSNEKVSVHIASGTEEGVFSLSVRDVLGEEVHREDISLTGAEQDVLLDVSSLASGMYVVSILSSRDSREIYRQKIVKVD